MFGWFNKKRVDKLEEDMKRSFSEVKRDMDVVGKWVKHLDVKDKQLFDMVREIQRELSSIHEEIDGVREAVELVSDGEKNKQVFKKLPVLGKQTAVEAVQEAVQTPVQTAEIYEILKNLSGNERLIVYSILNNEMKLSYEDLALILGKDKATIRGQVNAIKQKCEGLIEEIVEKSGKKRVFIPAEIREKLAKYAKVRVKKGGKK
ncbi:MAG: hypothetical protein Q7S27_01545 [Nanoarchaeota archaeon]|nr:hypothetical protein [Nanoarchaeota archaeon]